MMKPQVINLRCSPSEKPRDNQYFIDDEPLTEKDLARSLIVRNHSPAGFNHGYGGSGPSQLALAICLRVFGIAGKLVYMDFKNKHIANLPDQSENFNVWIDLTPYYQQLINQTDTLDFVVGTDYQRRIEIIENILYHPDPDKAFREVYVNVPQINGCISVPFDHMLNQLESEQDGALHQTAKLATQQMLETATSCIFL